MPAWWGVTGAPSAVGFGNGLSAVFLKAKPGEVSALPSSAHILSLVTRGEVRHKVWRDNRLIHDDRLPSRSINIVTAGVTPRALISAPIEVLHVYIPHSRLVTAAQEAGAGDVAQSLEVLDPRFRADAALIAFLEEVGRALCGSEWQDRLLLDGLGVAICARVIQRWSSLASASAARRSEHRVSTGDWRLRRAIEFLEAHLAEDVGLSEIASSVDLSPSHFAALFRAGTGEPPHRWLMRRRAERACELLADPRLTVTEIAHACGFASSQHLATVFRKRSGTTPSAYRLARLT